LSRVLNLGHRSILAKNFIRFPFTPRSGRPLGPSLSKYFGLVLEKKDPSEFEIIIYKTNIVTISGSHTSENTSSRGVVDTLEDLGKGNWWLLAH
jgi:hypothetical protein